MRKFNYIFILIAILGVALTSSCKKKSDDKETDEEIKTKHISKAWKVTGFTADGTTKDLAPNGDVVITFTDAKTYSVTNIEWLNASYNHSDVFQASGNWVFSDGLQKVILDGNKELVITSLDDDTFNFTYMSEYPKPSDTPKTMAVTTVPN